MYLDPTGQVGASGFYHGDYDATNVHTYLDDGVRQPTDPTSGTDYVRSGNVSTCTLSFAEPTGPVTAVTVWVWCFIPSGTDTHLQADISRDGSTWVGYASLGTISSTPAWKSATFSGLGWSTPTDFQVRFRTTNDWNDPTIVSALYADVTLSTTSVSVTDALAIADSVTKSGTSMPSLAYVQSKGLYSAGSAGTIALAPDSAFLSGSLVVVVASCGDMTGSTTATCADSVPQTYTLGVGPTRHATLGGTGFAQWLFYFSCSGPGTNTITVTFSTSVANRRIDILEYKGVVYTSLVDGTPVGATGTTGTPNSGSVTTSNASDLIFGGGLNDGGDLTAGTSAGFTQRVRADGYDCTEDKIVAATGNYSATFGTGTVNWIAQVIAFKSGSASPVTFSVDESLSVVEDALRMMPGRVGVVVSEDPLAIAEPALTKSLSTPSNVQVSVTDAVVLFESQFIDGGPLTFMDSCGVAESLTVWRSEIVVDNISDPETVSFAESLTVVRKGLGKSVSDTADLAEGVTIHLTNITMSVTEDILSVSDGLTVLRPTLTYGFLDAVSLSDSVDVGRGACVVECVETLDLSEEVSYTPSGNVYMSVTEVASLTDAVSKSFTKRVNTLYCFTALTGGAAAALDSLDGSALEDGDRAWATVGSASYWYYLDEDSGAADNGTTIIAPDTNAGSKRWIRCT